MSLSSNLSLLHTHSHTHTHTHTHICTHTHTHTHTHRQSLSLSVCLYPPPPPPPSLPLLSKDNKYERDKEESNSCQWSTAGNTLICTAPPHTDEGRMEHQSRTCLRNFIYREEEIIRLAEQTGEATKQQQTDSQNLNKGAHYQTTQSRNTALRTKRLNRPLEGWKQGQPITAQRGRSYTWSTANQSAQHKHRVVSS